METDADLNAAGEKARLRARELEERLERLRDGVAVTADDVAVQPGHAAESADRAESAALKAAQASVDDADLHDRLAQQLVANDPERAHQHRKDAQAARRRAEHERDQAGDH